jgi:hypothetical protein
MSAAVRKNTFLVVALALMLTLLFGVLAMFGGKPASAEEPFGDPGPEVQPTVVSGNPTCADLGYDFELKVDPPNSGTYTDGVLTVTVDSDGTYFDWTSNIGVDAVIVKGGNLGANSYVYDPPAESLGDDGLHAPNNSNGQPAGLSHMSFCYDLELAVTKDAHTSFKQTNDWKIDKSVSPDEWDLFKGDSGTSGYTVLLDKTVTESNYKVTGTISVYNPAPFAANVTDVSDVVSGVGAADVDCGGPFPITVASKDTLECSYSADLPDKADRTNTATATTNTAKLGNGTGTADVSFADAEVNEVGPASVTVSDTYAGDLGSFNDDGSATYERTFECDADEGTHNNTATINETGQSASASVKVNCYDLNVAKDASTSLKRTWTWTVDKSADQDQLTLSEGQGFLVNYEVKVDASEEDSDHAVSGKITVHNPAPIDATLNGVSDVVSGAGAADVDCGVSFPYTLAAGDTLECSYSSDLPDATQRTNTATATLQNYDYDPEGKGTADGTTDFSGSANVDFSNATVEEIDESIDVTDTLQGALGTVNASQAPKTFNYSRNVGPYEECGDYTVDNTASFVTNDTGATGEDSWTIDINVPCGGCTLTIGYWKTHADPSSPRANNDYTLELLAAQPNGTIWLGTLNGAKSVPVTSSNVVSILKFDGSNGIKKLQAQLLAAKLNIANGADDSAVQNTISAADLFLAQNGANGWDNLNKAKKQQVLSWMNTLDRYSNGLIGPGHCSEESTT